MGDPPRAAAGEVPGPVAGGSTRSGRRADGTLARQFTRPLSARDHPSDRCVPGL